VLPEVSRRVLASIVEGRGLAEITVDRAADGSFTYTTARG
jgi:hypothetical protein